MPQFFKFIFASCLGTLLAIGLFAFLGVGALASLAGSATEEKKVAVKPNSVLELNFDLALPEKSNNTEIDPFDMDHQDIPGAHDIIRTIREAKEDADIKGIYIQPAMLSMGKANAAAIRSALEDFKSSGKFIVSYSTLYSQNAYYLASVADSVLLNPTGAVEFKGYAATITFFKEMLDKMDVQMRIFYAGQFKSATEPFRLDKMSEPNRLQTRVYLNALYDIFINDIARSRNIAPDELRRIADNLDGFSAEKALSSHLIDRLAHEDQAITLMKNKIGLGTSERLNRIKLHEYYAAKVKNKKSGSGKDKIAVVYAEGEITDGKGSQPGTITDGHYVKILRKLRMDDNIKAIVLRINSPGGSVVASENIFREVLLCKEAGKPVVVSMANVAASGGYYIACQADSIFAEPATITGSIGVFGLIPILQKTMKENLGITVDTVKTARHSAFGSAMLDFSPEESQMIQSRIEATYEDFLTKVATGRHKTRDQVDSIAQGRVWPGTVAKSIGLVDDLGGLERAINAARQLANLDKYTLKEYPEAKTGMEQFIEKFAKKEDRDDMISASVLKAELGEMYPLYRSLSDMRKAKGIQARLPFELAIW